METNEEQFIENEEEAVLRMQHEVFVENYIQNGGKGTAAYRVAYQLKGSKMSNHTAAQGAWTLLQRPDVQQAIAKKRKEIAKAYRWSKKKLITELTDTYQKCQREQELYDPMGMPKGVFMFDSKGALSALDMITKIKGDYAPTKTEQKNSGEIKHTHLKVKIDLEKLTVEQLKVARELAIAVQGKTVDVNAEEGDKDVEIPE